MKDLKIKSTVIPAEYLVQFPVNDLKLFTAPQEIITKPS